MDAETRKALEDAYSQLMRSAATIRRLLNDDKPATIGASDLRRPNVSVSSADLQRLRD
jgi:hypothetical protein